MQMRHTNMNLLEHISQTVYVHLIDTEEAFFSTGLFSLVTVVF